jgi:hypothetical protein
LINSGKIVKKIIEFLGSRRFYVLILVLFIFESAWIAFSAIYPQAFDENFHFGLIQVYSHHWLPFLTSQSASADAYGAITRDPSFLYHYLMSFPYRFIALFVHSTTGQVILLRLIDVGMFTGGIILFNRILNRVGVSKSLINVSLLLFVLIPIVPQLAAQINYDDMVFILTAWICLQAFNITDEVKAHKPSAKSFLILASTGILACLVKYAFIPIFASVVLFLLATIFFNYRHNLKKFFKQLTKSFKVLSKWPKLGLIILLLISIGLFMQRDGYNLIKYHTFVPDCSKVLSVKQCSAYSAWYVDYARHQQVVSGVTPASANIVSYTRDWFYWMWYRLFFAVNGPLSDFNTIPPLPLPSIAAAVLAGVSGLVIIRWRKQIFYHKPYLTLLLTICVIYCISLFTKAYATYKYTAVLENMNGRYLIPILLPIAAIAGLAFSRALRRSQSHKVLAVIVVVLLFLQGGGVLTFIVRSDSTWYWPNSKVVRVNDAVNKIANRLVVKKVRRN